MAFNLIQLETFRRLALEKNFTRTAEYLNLTQPAVTQHIRALQEHFRVKFVNVVSRKTTLTDAGRFLADRVETLRGTIDVLERDMREFADVRASELRIGATVTIGAYALPKIVARFRASYPDLRLLVDVQNTADTALSVKLGRVSLALVEGPLEDETLDIEPYTDDELVLVLPATHRFARRRSQIEIAKLAQLAFIFREEGSGTRRQVESALLEVGIVPEITLTLPTGEGIMRSVELGTGAAIVSQLVAADCLHAGRVARVRVRGLQLHRTFRIVRLRSLTRRPRYSRTLSETTMIARATDVLANERTFLAYLRTSLSFIAFGFVIARFALFTREIAELSHATIQSPGFSNAFGIAVAVFGTTIALFGGYRYVEADRAIRADGSARLPLFPALIITGIVTIIGVAVSAVLVLVR